MSNDNPEWEADFVPFDPDQPSLQDIARQTYASAWSPLKESDISSALTKADIDPTNEKERERFRRLVAAITHTTAMDSVGSDHSNRALDKLGADAREEDALKEARGEAHNDQMERELPEEDYKT